MRFGPNAQQATVMRRAVDADGNRTGLFAPAFGCWSSWTQNPGRLAAVSGQREDPIDLLLRVNDTPNTRTISNADRIAVADTSFEIDSVGLPERKSGSISLTLRRESNS